MEVRVVGPGDEEALGEMFSHIDETFFRPHAFTRDEATRICHRGGRDLYVLMLDDGRPVAYGMLRGLDEGYTTPSLGIAVSTECQGRGIGRLMMEELHQVAANHGADVVRLRVHPDNVRARHLYEALGYTYRGEDRGELLMTVPVTREKRHPQAAPGVTLFRADSQDWDAIIAAAPRSVFHTAGYHRYTAGFGAGEPFLAVVGDQDRGLAWPYVLGSAAEVAGLERSDAKDVNSAYGYPGPIAWGCTPGDAFLRDALARVADTWRLQGAVSAFTRFNPLLRNEVLLTSPGILAPGVAGDGVLVNGTTVSVDLTLADAEILAGYRRDLGRRIRLGHHAGLTTIHDEAWAWLPAFADLYLQTMQRLGASQFYLFADEDFARLRASLPANAHLLVTLQGGVVAAAGLFLEYDGVVEWHLVGSSDAAQQPVAVQGARPRCHPMGKGPREPHPAHGRRPWRPRGLVVLVQVRVLAQAPPVLDRSLDPRSGALREPRCGAHRRRPRGGRARPDLLSRLSRAGRGRSRAVCAARRGRRPWCRDPVDLIRRDFVVTPRWPRPGRSLAAGEPRLEPGREVDLREILGRPDVAAAASPGATVRARMRRSRPEAPVVHVPRVQFEAVLEAQRVASVDNRPAGDPWPHEMPTPLAVRVARQVLHQQWPGPDQAHLAS